MLRVSNLKKSYGTRVLFSDANFNVNLGERVGLVGRNGHGKSTFFRIMLGEEEATEGNVTVPKSYTIGHLEQSIHFTRPTIVEEGCLGLPESMREDAWRVEKVLFGLGFSKKDMGRPPAEFSGGFQVRLNLAKVLVSECNLLLLDEPTNYLDVVSMRWLERFLSDWPGELVLITHDRGFMDSVVTHIVGIHRQRVRKVEGTTEKYFSQIAAEEDIYEKTRLNDERERKRADVFISKFRAKARQANMVQSRIKQMEKREKLERLENIKTMDFSFNSVPLEAKVFLDIKELGFGYGENGPLLFKNLSFHVAGDDRVCVVGPNGRGKTTLLRIIADELTPRSGLCKKHPSLKVGYFGQTNVARLNPNFTVEQEVQSANAELNRKVVRDICGAMLFEGDEALKKISLLSGGERARVLLARLLAAPCNVLLLDEPTNHLDLESSNALLSALEEFDGAVIIVTHNEYFLRRIATQLVVFDRDKAMSYLGHYDTFLKEIGWANEDSDGPSELDGGASKPSNAPREVVNKKELRRLRAQIIEERSKALRPFREKMETAESHIERIEAEIKSLETRFLEASQNGDGPKLSELSKTKNDLEWKTAEHFKALESATGQFEAISKEFEAKINQYK